MMLFSVSLRGPFLLKRGLRGSREVKPMGGEILAVSTSLRERLYDFLGISANTSAGHSLRPLAKLAAPSSLANQYARRVKRGTQVLVLVDKYIPWP